MQLTGQTAAQGCVNNFQDLGGKPLLRAPNFTFSLGADYNLRFSDNWLTTLSVNGSHSASYQTATDYAPGGFQDSYWLLDAAVRVSFQDHYELAFLGRNLTNTYYTLNTVGWSGVNSATQPNTYVGFFNRPREVVLEATVKF